jgi:hypothetical protein
VAQLGRNAHGEVLEPGRVSDCYLGLLLEPPSDRHAGRVLVVAPAALLHPCVPQPDGTLLYGVPPISRRVGYLALKGDARLPGVLPV